MKLTDTEWSLICNALRRHAEMSKLSAQKVLAEDADMPASKRLAETLIMQCEDQIALAEKIEEKVGV